MAKQEVGKSTSLEVRRVLDVGTSGSDLLNNSFLNKGSAFPDNERTTFKLHGLLPPRVDTLEQQLERAWWQLNQQPSDLLKNAFCESLKLQNTVLYYALIKKHLVEIMSIIYTPTEGDAIQQYSHLFRKPEGCFLSIDRPESILPRLARFGDAEDIDYIVVTDSEGILGIGDQGVGGIGISIAKLALLTACGGVHPNRVLPVVLDVGTNNRELLNDPLYMGLRRERAKGEDYDHFVDKFVEVIRQQYPLAVLHFEDFGVTNATRILQKYQDKFSVFNDDIQGTGAVALSAIKGALHSTNRSLRNAKILIFGAGSAGTGIANQCVDNLTSEGQTETEARENILLIDIHGLVTTALSDDQVTSSQKPFAVDHEQWEGVNTSSLYEVVKQFKPHILIGTSTRPKSFSKEVVREMAKHVDRPIILPLSNPTRLHEATPEDLIAWTEGKVLVATGSPFPPVQGREISEANNFLIFPGVGLGAILSRSKLISKGMLAAAIDKLAELSPVLKDPEAPLLPPLAQITDIAAHLATAVVLKAFDEDLAAIEYQVDINTRLPLEIPRDYDQCYTWVKGQMWQPVYVNYRRAIGYNS